MLSQRGITLVEILLVMVIVGLLISLAPPVTTEITRAWTLTTTTDRIASVIYTARYKSMTEGLNMSVAELITSGELSPRSYYVIFDENTDAFTVFLDKDGDGVFDPGEGAGKDFGLVDDVTVAGRNTVGYQLPEGMSLTTTFPGDKFQFTSRGIVTPAGKITLTYHGKTKTITVSLGGRIEIS